MEKVKKYWKIALIGTIVIFICIPLGLILSKGTVEQAQTEQVGTLLAQAKLYSPLNIGLLLVLPVMLSVFLLNSVKGEKTNKEFFIVQAVLLIVPYIINAIILVMIKFIGGFGNYLSFLDILKWLGTSILIGILICAISNFIGCFTKNRITHTLSTYGFLFIPALIAFAFDRVLGTIIYGYISETDSFIKILAEWPGMKPFDLFSYEYLNNFGALHIVVYIAIIALLVFGTYKILNKQKTYNVVSMITIYSFVLLLTLILIESISLIMNIMLATLLSILLASVAYVICVLFIKQKNIKKLAISYGIYSVVVFVVILIIQGNIFGYETNIPEAEEVDYAVFSTTNPLLTEQIITYREKENIQCIIDTQKKLVENQTSIRETDKTYYKYYVQYNLKDGRKITRVYNLGPVYIEIYDSEEFIDQRYIYIVNEEVRANISEIRVLGIYNDKAFEIDFSQEDELFTKIAENITSDLKTQKAYKSTDDLYGMYAATEGIQYLLIDVAIGNAVTQNYVAYASTNETYELVKTVQELINSESDKIVWEEE